MLTSWKSVNQCRSVRFDIDLYPSWKNAVAACAQACLRARHMGRRSHGQRERRTAAFTRLTTVHCTRRFRRSVCHAGSGPPHFVRLLPRRSHHPARLHSHPRFGWRLPFLFEASRVVFRFQFHKWLAFVALQNFHLHTIRKIMWKFVSSAMRIFCILQ